MGHESLIGFVYISSEMNRDGLSSIAATISLERCLLYCWNIKDVSDGIRMTPQLPYGIGLPGWRWRRSYKLSWWQTFLRETHCSRQGHWTWSSSHSRETVQSSHFSHFLWKLWIESNNLRYISIRLDGVVCHMTCSAPWCARPRCPRFSSSWMLDTHAHIKATHHFDIFCHVHTGPHHLGYFYEFFYFSFFRYIPAASPLRMSRAHTVSSSKCSWSCPLDAYPPNCTLRNAKEIHSLWLPGRIFDSSGEEMARYALLSIWVDEEVYGIQCTSEATHELQMFGISEALRDGRGEKGLVMGRFFLECLCSTSLWQFRMRDIRLMVCHIRDVDWFVHCRSLPLSLKFTDVSVTSGFLVTLHGGVSRLILCRFGKNFNSKLKMQFNDVEWCSMYMTHMTIAWGPWQLLPGPNVEGLRALNVIGRLIRQSI